MSESEVYEISAGPFSNFAISLITLDDQWGRPHVYRTVEHWVQASKATTPEDHDWVLEPGDDTWAVKRRGKKVKLRPDWDEVKYDILLQGLRAKFAREWPGVPHAAIGDFQSLLLMTGDREIVDDSPTDFAFGSIDDNFNLLGKALMQVREEIRNG